MHAFNTQLMNDHDLLHGGVMDLVEENRASARRWARLVELHHRRPDTDGNFAMSGREWIALETSEVWAVGDNHARSQLNIALFLSEHLPEVWTMCLDGALDRYRATVVADLLRHRLDDPADWAAAATRITAFLRKHLHTYAEFNIEMVTCTITQLRNRLNYVIRCFAPADDEYTRLYDERTVHVFEPEAGIGHLSVTTTIDQALLARHRLHLSASQGPQGSRRPTDPRPADERPRRRPPHRQSRRPPGPSHYARPIINVTVSLETLAGLSDDPGQLSGGTVIPADLARAIATSDGATWFRLLTDPAGEPVSLSTKSYQPTETIWRHLVAIQHTCTHPACDRPSVQCELDHVLPWPAGQTTTANLAPLCRRHHKAKHARAERPDLDWEYGAA